MKIDPSGHLLISFIDLNNLALSRFSPEERRRIMVHTCPGNDLDSTHSADVEYDVRIRHCGAPVQATIAGDSFCAVERLHAALA